MIDWLLGLCNPTYDWLSLCNNWQMDVCTWLEDSRKRLSPDIKASFRIERKIHNYKIFTKTYANKSSPLECYINKPSLNFITQFHECLLSGQYMFPNLRATYFYVEIFLYKLIDLGARYSQVSWIFPLLFFSSVYTSRYIT